MSYIYSFLFFKSFTLVLDCAHYFVLLLALVDIPRIDEHFHILSIKKLDKFITFQYIASILNIS